MALYIVSMHIIHSNSRTSTHWKLNLEEGKVQPQATVAGGDGFLLETPEDDPLMNILTNKLPGENGGWRLESQDTCSDECREGKHMGGEPELGSTETHGHTGPTVDKNISHNNGKKTTSSEKPSGTKKKKNGLDCGKPVNLTEYDNLRGIANRHNHPHIPEPEVAMIFRKKGSKNTEVDMNELEKRLKKTRKEKPKSAQVYNQIGNFWRIKGNTQLSIECFRKALSFSPNNPDVLLNLARVLFNLEYLDDAILLTKRSLEMQSPDQNSWLQHFTLGEILKAHGHFHEATFHFRHTLDLNPGFHPAQAHLREMEINPDGTVTYYTLFIILFLVLGVLCGIITSIDGNLEELGETMKTQRHFNRAMAMRSIKLGINPKLIRMRKQYSC